MTTLSPFQDFAARLRGLVVTSSAGRGDYLERSTLNPTPSPPLGERDGERWHLLDDAHFNELALSLFKLQFAHNSAYRRFCEARGLNAGSVPEWANIPAMPSSGFKELELTALPLEARTTVFNSSGTTAQTRSRHFHSIESLDLYEASLLAWFPPHFPNACSTLFLFLTPQPEEVPHSSLVYMFDTIRREFGSDYALFTGVAHPDGAWSVDVKETVSFLRDAIAAKLPVTLFGTAFNFVHLLDEFAKENLRFELPPGSCVLETGGYKGRSRVVAKPELHAQIAERLGVPANCIVSEYGMSELSSQAYDWKVGQSCENNPERTISLSPQRGPRSAERSSFSGELTSGGLGKPLGRGEGWENPLVNSGTVARVFHFPPWARAQIINPETGREAAEGETGLIRVFDLANVYSVMAVQTEDLGVRRGEGFELLGRATMAESRGCSLMTI